MGASRNKFLFTIGIHRGGAENAERDVEGAHSPRLSQRSLRLRGEVLTSPAVLISCCPVTQNGRLVFYASLGATRERLSGSEHNVLVAAAPCFVLTSCLIDPEMRILIVKLSSIGDVVHALPAVAAIRRCRPSAKITWVVDSRASAILRDSPAIDELVEINPRQEGEKELTGRLGIIGLFRRPGNAAEPPDIAIDLQGLIKSGFVAYASGAARRVGFESSELRESVSRIFLTEQVKTSHMTHVIEKNLELVRASLNLKIDQERYEFPIAVPPEDDRYIDGEVSGDSRFAIINPGGGWPTKLWPPERFGLLADWLSSEYGFSSLVTYGPGEEELAESVASCSRSSAARPFASTLKQFVALARRAKLFIGGDTGPLHIAAASGTPIVGLYGPTSPARNGPFDGRDVTVGVDLWCRADCHRRSCWHWRCMDIPLSDAQQAIRARLDPEQK